MEGLSLCMHTEMILKNVVSFSTGIVIPGRTGHPTSVHEGQ